MSTTFLRCLTQVDKIVFKLIERFLKLTEKTERRHLDGNERSGANRTFEFFLDIEKGADCFRVFALIAVKMTAFQFLESFAE